MRSLAAGRPVGSLRRRVTENDALSAVLPALVDTVPYRLFAFSGAGGWESGDNPTLREETSALGAELHLAGPAAG
jgi:hypothetical protein